MTPRQTRALKEAQAVLQSYLPSMGGAVLCVSEVKARISEILEKVESHDASKANDAVVDLLRSVRAELARNFADPEAPIHAFGAKLH